MTDDFVCSDGIGMRTAEYQAARCIQSWVDAAQGAASTWASSPLALQLSLS